MIRDGTANRSNLKHIDIKLTWIAEIFAKENFDIAWIAGKDNPTDIFTKVMKSVALFESACDKILPPASH